MTNIYGRPEKLARQHKLIELGERALKKEGWLIENVSGKAPIYHVVKGKKKRTVSIRTTQDTRVSFQRKADDSGWTTLDEVDFVVIATVDDKDDPKYGLAYLVDGGEMRKRFNRNYQARLKAGQKQPADHGMWVPMFEPENPSLPSSKGGGIAIGRQPSLEDLLNIPSEADTPQAMPTATAPQSDASLTIAEAKHGLAQTFGVAPENVKIVIEA